MNPSPDIITGLAPFECFVFGSNLAGIHGAGAAAMALGWGAAWGEGVGFSGNTYAIPTKNRNIVTMRPDEIRGYVHDFILFAGDIRRWTFLVTEIGCGLAGHSPKDIAPLFAHALQHDNIRLPKRFLQILQP